MIERIPILLVRHITCHLHGCSEKRRLLIQSKIHIEWLFFPYTVSYLMVYLGPRVVLHMDLLVGRFVSGYHLQVLSLPSPFLARVPI